MAYRKTSGRIETGRSICHVPEVDNPVIQESLRKYRIFTTEAPSEISSSLLTPAAPGIVPESRTHWVISFDGSQQEVAVKEQFPSTRVGYIQIAGVLIQLERLLAQEKSHLVDPAEIQAASKADLYSVVLPGSNVCTANSSSVADSWRIS